MKQYKHKKTGTIVVGYPHRSKILYMVISSLFSPLPEVIPAWVVEGSEDWEVVQLTKCPICGKPLPTADGDQEASRHWEISAFRDKPTGSIIKRQSKDFYAGGEADNIFKGTAKSFLEAQEDRYEVFSVYRTCDKAEFQIGDYVLAKDGPDQITGFTVEGSNCLLNLEDVETEKPHIMDKKIIKVHVYDMRGKSVPSLIAMLENLFGETIGKRG